MDSKNRINETYLPDKNAKGEKVAIALWGLDSFVTAYLLKIQKYELMAFTVVNDWKPDEAQKLMNCYPSEDRIKSIKDFCQQLSIPHQFIKTGEEFSETVVSTVEAARLGGSLPQPCWSCHTLRMKTVFARMKQLGLTKLATGHYAKVFKHESTQTCFVHTSNDEVNDQSGLLSRLPHEILSSLILPLSDLQKKEVLKLAENFALEAQTNPVGIHKCFSDPEYFTKSLLPKLSEKFTKGGEVCNMDGSENYGDHEGIIQHGYGEFYLKAPGKEDLYFAHFSNNDKKIHLAPKSFFTRSLIHLTHCHLSDETPWTAPIKGSVQITANTFADCWVHPGSLNSALVEFETPQYFKEGQIININRKQGKNAKVYLTGKVRFFPEIKEVTEHEAKIPKANYNRDF